MARTNIRVPLPTNPTEAIALLNKVKDKHEELGTNSPLTGLKWNLIVPDLENAETHDAEAARLSKIVEKEYGDRNRTMPTVIETLRASRDVLLGLNRDNPKALGDFGFTVDDTPRAAKKSSTSSSSSSGSK